MKIIFYILPLAVFNTVLAIPQLSAHDVSKIIASGWEKTTFLLQDTLTPVKIQLEKASSKDMNILFISDTASGMNELGAVLSKDYGLLMAFARYHQLKTMKLMAWYYSVGPPWKMDVALETDKLPNETTIPIKSRIDKGGEVLIAHMWGPYSELKQAYTQIENWLKENNRSARSHPFEVYLNDPLTVQDPSQIQTDIYQPIE